VEGPELHGYPMRGMRLPLILRFCSCNYNSFHAGLLLTFYLIIYLLRFFILWAHGTSCIVETSSGISMWITVPSPGRLWMSKLKSVPYKTRKRSRTLLKPMPST
jgi:hypothetical protein